MKQREPTKVLAAVLRGIVPPKIPTAGGRCPETDRGVDAIIRDSSVVAEVIIPEVSRKKKGRSSGRRTSSSAPGHKGECKFFIVIG
jgi:hypothetical protein